MYNFNKGNFAEFMLKKYKIIVDKSRVGEESVSLDKGELDECLISKEVRKRLPDQLIVHTCAYKEKNEWIVGVICAEHSGMPLVLICLKEGNRIFEGII
ncbi:hypothetical protein NIE88_09770 [Sporolactobacillus shoreicorticis]|uniref:DUF4258 domain-containing protein n=1 Tax=Sporolactobacillus shoreicorticis TaxID=1923877 RepID=A0ABW5S8I3_9BACL|nr:hypothetical protein [Sporolactobacillus shoreicorticis]MCO7126063.1 hypothetical protein [Sporolactobacillus shoreicorticis]